MTENLYEFNDLTNSSNGLNVTRCGYPTHSTASIQPSPVYPHVNQKFAQSPTTPQNDLSPLLDIPHDEGSWNPTQLEKPAFMLYETMNSQVVYPFNIADTLHGLDSFSKTFPGTKNPNTAFVNSEKNSEDNHLSDILLSPQSETPSAGSDREPFSPVTMHSRSLHCHNHLMHHHHHPPDRQTMAYNPYQSQHYGYQHHKPQLRENNLVSVPFNKSQNQYLLQHQGHQVQQQHRTSYSLSQQKQQIPMDVQDGHDSIGSPTDSCTKDLKASEQTVFQASLHSPYFQGSQNFHSFTHPSDIYQHQQANDPTHSFPFKENPSFETTHAEEGNNVPRFFIQKEDVYMDLNYHHKQEDYSSYHYQSVGSGVNQTAQPPAVRGGGLHHLNSYSPPCEQMRSSDIQEDQQLPCYRTEAPKAEGIKTKLKCLLCHREFKSLPALNGHMRSHGGFRPNPLMLKTTDEQIHLSEEVTPIGHMVFPVSVPVKDCLFPSRPPNNFHNQLKHKNLDDSVSDEGSPQRQKIILSRAKSGVGAGDGATKQQKKRYRHCLVPLVIFPHGAGPGSRGPVLFKSQLRSPGSCGDDIPYTPPPMLSPIRPGSGLFNRVNAKQQCTGAQTASQVRLCKESDKHGCSATLETGDISSSIKPRINIGSNFQAEIPDIQNCSNVSQDTHKANLLWTPCYLDTYEKHQRVDDLLKMACSSVLPGGGTNTEYTLHCLFECSGDIMKTLEKLLSVTTPKHRSSLHTNYHYAGSDKWTLQEKRQVNKALLIYNKDFHLIQKMVKTKSVAQCVEYYYTWKEKLRMGRRFSTGPVTQRQAKENRVQMKEANTRPPAHETKNKTGALKCTKQSDSISGAFVGEVPTSGSILNGNEWKQSNIGELCNSPAEYNRSKSAQHFGTGSVKSSPSNSSTSGDTESNLIFPCNECGKVFLKVKSRNAHMKTHRQHDDLKFWQLQRLPEQESNTVTPASPTVGLLPITHYSVSCSKNGDIKALFNSNA